MLKSPHPSIRPNPFISEYALANCKTYYLPLHRKSFFDPTLCRGLGCENSEERTTLQIQSSLVQAQKGKFQWVKIPMDRIEDPVRDQVCDFAQDYNLGIILQVAESFLNQEAFVKFLLALPKDYTLEILLENQNNNSDWSYLKTHFAHVYFTVVVSKNTHWQKLIGQRTFDQVHLHFPFCLDHESLFLTCSQAHKVVTRLRRGFPKTQFLPPRGVDIHDPRVAEDFPLEPFLTPCFETKSQNPQPRVSVIIPSYNSQNHLRVTLEHLYRQDIGHDAYEIIVVDDGGTDHSQRLVMEWLSQRPEPMNFKYIFFPRARQRVMGDSQYRAGIARNLGAKNAEGNIFSFLDSDIVVPQNYLASVEKGLQAWDALQARRINLKEEASTLDCRYENINPCKDVTAEDPYWEKFNAKTDHWHQMPFNWKYVCTHSFSLKKDLFWNLGALKRNFIFYGFEDTDLGYRITKTGHKLHLLDMKVYHLFHDDRRSEFQNMKSLRHILLSRTAQIFYLHHLDEDIYFNLNGFMAPEFRWKPFLQKAFRWIRSPWLWRRSDQVFVSLRSQPGSLS
ncbi:MAG: glycosyltransferase [Bdellovibrionales bacterium]|nr:glycosyltransferase [Bdellovibrionales bacterium]